MTPAPLSRRAFLARSALIGCSAAASPLVTPMSFAAAPWDQRLVVIILRGGMDGLGVVQPYGDPAYSALRGRPDFDAEDGPVDLDGFFAMHGALRGLKPMWDAQELGFFHAVSTPYRDKRSHFDGQDLLEAGTSVGTSARDGWLNRMLQAVPGVETQTAFAIGQDRMAVIDGPAPYSSWTPESDLALSPQALRLAQLVMAEDPALKAALDTAFSLADSDGDAVAMSGSGDDMMAAMAQDATPRGRGQATRAIAEFAASRLRGDSRIATFSINGWDTHGQQDRHLSGALRQLDLTLQVLRDELRGDIWRKTLVVAMTEFGRTARLNGTRGTDHGTGGAMVLAGGALRGGRVWSDWPGLDEANLYQRRDLMPTRDVRDPAAWAMHGLFGLDRATLERQVFPGLELGADPGLLR